MKFYTIAMFVLLMNVSLAIINYINPFDYVQAYQKEWLDEVGNADHINQSYSNSNIDADTSTNDGNFKKGLSLLVSTLFYATIGFPWMFHNFGLDMGLSLLISIPIYVVYIIGILQFFSKQSLEGLR